MTKRLVGALLLVCGAALAQNDITVNAITQTSDGYLWIGGERGLQRYNGFDFVPTSLGTTAIASLAGDSTGALWIGTHDHGLYRLRDGTVTPVAGAGRSVWSLAEDHLHTMWAAGDDGVRRFDETRAAPLSTGGAPNTASRAVCASGTDVWIGTDEGLFRYDGGLRRLSNDVVTALAADREGKLWIGAQEGVEVYADGAFTKPAVAAPLATTDVIALTAARDGTVWISGAGKGVCRLSRDGLDCDPVDANVRAIYEDREGTMWLGTTNSGLRHLPAGVMVVPSRDPAPHVTLRASDGSGWTGSPAGLTHNGRTYTVYDGLATTSVHALAEDRDGSIWIGTTGGLSRYAGGKITTIESDGDADVRALRVDARGDLWIGTTSGLRCVSNGRLVPCGEGRARSAPIYAFDEVDGAVTIAPPLDGAVFGIVRDDSGHVWYSTNVAVYRGTSPVYAVPSNGLVQPAAWRNAGGHLSFETSRGVAIVDPKRAGVTSVPPPVRIESAKVSDGHAEFRYVALTFTDPQNVQYRTMLEGFDADWIDAGKRRIAEYDRLPPGRYTFRVMSGSSAASMKVEIPPPFWRTWWFAGLMLFAIAGVALIAYMVRRENARLEQLASVDPLTQLANRRMLDAALQRKWAAVILCDIDHFKLYNDTFGHQAGDRTLARVAQAIASMVDPATGLAARYGGEEFIVLLSRATAEDAARIAGRILDAMRAQRIPHRDGIVTLSAGVAAGDSGNLIGDADEALYRAKAEGRNRFVMAANVRASSAR